MTLGTNLVGILALASFSPTHLAFASQYEGCPQVYSNGAPAFNARGDLLYPNGSPAHTAGSFLYPSGDALAYRGHWFYPTGQNFAAPSSSPQDPDGNLILSPHSFSVDDVHFSVDDVFTFEVRLSVDDVTFTFRSNYKVSCSSR